MACQYPALTAVIVALRFAFTGSAESVVEPLPSSPRLLLPQV